MSILYILITNMNNIKDILQKHNGFYPCKNKTEIDDIISKISSKINDDIISQISSKLNIDKKDLQNVIAKYSYIFDEQLVLDTNNKTNNDYASLTSLFMNSKILPIRHNGVNPIFGPFGTDWIHDVQKDDNVNTPDVIRRRKQFEKLCSIKYPAQRSPEWYVQRDGKITASDAGVVIGENKYEQPYRMIVKKTRETFQNNEATYHGKKHEDIAKLIYEYRMNVHVHEFGMVPHETVTCIGASPDGIVTPYKNDMVHLTELVGRMLEIKVPLRRQICTTGEIKGDICPIYYWDQTQLQMECCDLDECDFWQCTICEYPNRDLFIADTCKSEPFRSKTTSFEKGCLVQLLPSDKIVPHKDPNYLNVIHEYAQFIHPPRIEMTPEECDTWVEETLKKIPETHPTYSYDRTVWWYLKVGHNVTIQRNKQWFADNKHKYEKMWDDITLIRSEQDYKDMFLGFVDATSIGDKDYNLEPLRNKIIFAFINKLHDSAKLTNKEKLTNPNKLTKNISKKIVNFITTWNNKLKEITKKNILEDKLNELFTEFEKIF